VTGCGPLCLVFSFRVPSLSGNPRKYSKAQGLTSAKGQKHHTHGASVNVNRLDFFCRGAKQRPFS